MVLQDVDEQLFNTKWQNISPSVPVNKVLSYAVLPRTVLNLLYALLNFEMQGGLALPAIHSTV